MKKISFKLIAIFIAFALTIMPICFAATTKSELENQKNDIKNQIDEKKDEFRKCSNRKIINTRGSRRFNR